MIIKLSRITQCLILMSLCCVLAACGTGSSSSSTKNTFSHNGLTQAGFRDTDPSEGIIGGEIDLEGAGVENQTELWEAVSLYWSNSEGVAVGDAWLVIDLGETSRITIPQDTILPAGINSLILYPNEARNDSTNGIHIVFHDFVGNAQLSGPGGNEQTSWRYGDDRPTIPIQRLDNGLCIFDNGLVAVTDMSNEVDSVWVAQVGSGEANQVDEAVFPPYMFECDEAPINTHREVSDEIGVWNYSTLNDAMFYGTIVYDTFLKYLGEPALQDKIRLRVHYGSLSSQKVYWDGAYANFGDAYPFYYSMLSIDSIAHEIAHGVLNRISKLKFYNTELSTDARTLHEAFGDISALMAKYEFTGDLSNWTHDEGIYGYSRQLDQIKTEFGAIASMLDYEDAGDNYYLRIGMITYPFYVLANKWSIETAYGVYIRAARHCWTAMTTLTDAAQCIHQQAVALGLPGDDVVEAFKAVKIKLFEEGVLGHFEAEINSLQVKFLDTSLSTSEISNSYWDFGDGNDSAERNPTHNYDQPGEYQVRLIVTDLSDEPDLFERRISVTN